MLIQMFKSNDTTRYKQPAAMYISRMDLKLFDDRQDVLFDLLDKHNGDLRNFNKSELARRLNIPRITMYRWLKKYQEKNEAKK